MSTTLNKSFARCETIGEALEELCGAFGGISLTGDCYQPLEPDEMPEPYRRLLVHHAHMTVVLQEYHRSPVNLYVMAQRRDGDWYSRKIFLTRGMHAPAVELGVVRINLAWIAEAAKREILEHRKPLGSVLIEHGVLRRVEPRWYARFPSGSRILRWFGYPQHGPFYGRVGTIYCGGEPAIELLEIATLWE